MTMSVLHFVGFRGDEFHRAVRVFGYPDFIHYAYDHRALADMDEGDVVVFATGDEYQRVLPSWDDSSFFVRDGVLHSMQNDKAPYPDPDVERE